MQATRSDGKENSTDAFVVSLFINVDMLLPKDGLVCLLDEHLLPLGGLLGSLAFVRAHLCVLLVLQDALRRF